MTDSDASTSERDRMTEDEKAELEAHKPDSGAMLRKSTERGDSSGSVADQSSLSRGWFGSEPSACALSAPDAMVPALSGGRS